MIAARLGLVVVVVVAAAGGCKSRHPSKSGSRVAKKAPRSTNKQSTRVGSPLPERGPHPDYPTPVAAGTGDLFVLEEPDRGPAAPIDFPLPGTVGLAWSSHANCEAGAETVTCSKAKRHPGEVSWWHVGRRGKTFVVAEHRRGDAIDETYVYVQNDTVPRRRIRFDAYNQVESALLFSSPTQYSKRLRSGANGLDGCGSIAVELDAAHVVTEERCLQWSGKPMRDTDGVAVRKYKLDAQGFVVEETRFGVDGKPVEGIDGVHTIRYELDDDGRVEVKRFDGVDGQPTANNHGCHGYRTTRDARGVVVKRTCIGSDGKPSNDTGGISSDVYTYDEAGCQVTHRLLAIGHPPKDPGSDDVVDGRCAIMVHTCVGPGGNRRKCGPGEPARYDYKRDADGYVTSVSSYKPDGTPGEHPDWHAFEVRYQYDDRGRAVATSCHGTDGQPVLCGTMGYSSNRATYDDAGRMLEERFFDIHGNPTTNVGATYRTFVYDNYDHVSERRALDGAHEPVESLGMAVRRNLYDADHRLFGVVLLDKAGKPARYNGCYSGVTCPRGTWHAMRILRHRDGSVDTNEFFDAAGQLIHTVDCSKSRCFQ